MSLLEKIKDKAREDFKNNFRWDGVTPYFAHLEAVREASLEALRNHPYFTKNKTTELIMQIVALSHDFSEGDIPKYENDEEKLIADFKVLDTENELTDGDWKLITAILKGLNKNYYKSYLDYILQAKENFYSLKVKIADINHNLINLKGKKRDKYLLARHILESLK